MRKEEINCLKGMKRSEGKSETKIKEEINELIFSQIQFKILKKEVKKFINKIEKLEEENGKLKSKLFIKELSPEKESTKKESTVYLKTPLCYFSRMIKVMKSENKPLTMRTLKENCLFNKTEHVKNCLQMLRTLGLLKEIKKSGVSKYLLK